MRFAKNWTTEKADFGTRVFGNKIGIAGPISPEKSGAQHQNE
jgi:hypothetical protein